MWGVTAGKASHNASNARGVTPGKMGRNSSGDNDDNIIQHLFLRHISYHCGHSEAHCNVKDLHIIQLIIMINTLT